MARRSDYDIVRVEHDRVFIIDLDLGNKSVTNDAENVYIELQSFWPDRRIIYRDSAGVWDEIELRKNFFGGSLNWQQIQFKEYKEHIPNI
jgi:hypothetical protein